MNGDNWIRLEGRTYGLRPGERALDALLRQGAPVTFSCRKGTCRSCLLQATSGDPGPASQAPLPPEMREAGLFLPCCATDVTCVEARRPDPSTLLREAVLAERIEVAPDLLRLRFEPMAEFDWTAGQVIGLQNPAGETRSYSVVTSKADYFLEIDVRVHPGGAVSGWAAGLDVGDAVRFLAPAGRFVWSEDLADRPLLLIGTGCGGGVLAGIARDAVRRGHRGPIRLFHRARTAAELYLSGLLDDLPAGRVELVETASNVGGPASAGGRITDLAFASGEDLSETAVFLCGHPDMVEAARIRAVAGGARLDLIRADPFEPPEPYQTTEDAKLAAIRPDPEFWLALGNGSLLTTILTEFYTQVFADERLAPFFHRVTMQRAIEKQYSFLQDLLHGTKLYFGEKPFNAHHWMVISDELFDYRERMFFAVVRRHGVPEPMIRRWAALHETFRREMVKSAPRGLLRQGQEVTLEGYAREVMDVGSVCDGCAGEVEAGASVLAHVRTGEIFCNACEGHRHLGAA